MNHNGCKDGSTQDGIERYHVINKATVRDTHPEEAGVYVLRCDTRGFDRDPKISGKAESEFCPPNRDAWRSQCLFPQL